MGATVGCPHFGGRLLGAGVEPLQHRRWHLLQARGDRVDEAEVRDEPPHEDPRVGGSVALRIPPRQRLGRVRVVDDGADAVHELAIAVHDELVVVVQPQHDVPVAVPAYHEVSVQTPVSLYDVDFDVFDPAFGGGNSLSWCRKG